MGKTRLAIRGVLLHENQIGIMYVNEHDCYLFPGGALEENETQEECLIREMEEETGYLVEVVDHLAQVIGQGEEHKTELEINWGIDFTYRTIQQLQHDCEIQLGKYPESMIHQSLIKVVYAVINKLTQRGLIDNGNSK